MWLERKVILAILGGVFVGLAALSFFPNSPFLILLKVLAIIAAIGGGLYYWNQLQEEEPAAADDAAEPVIELETATEDTETPAEEEHLGAETFYHQFLQTLFPIIADTLVADDVALLLANPRKSAFTVRHYYHRQEAAPLLNQFPLEATLPGIVFRQQTVLIEDGWLGQAEQLLPYHPQESDAQGSFLGVPVFYKQKAIGVLAVTAGAEGAFSEDDARMLQHFAHLVELELVQSSQMFRYEQESWQNVVYLEIARGLHQVKTLDQLWEYLAGAFQHHFKADRVAFARRVDEQTGMVIYTAGEYRGILPESQFNLQEGLVGWLLRNGKDLLVEDFQVKENYIPRFSENEPPAREYRSLVGIPLIFQEGEAVVVVLEAFAPQQFSDQTRELLKSVGALVELFVEKQRRIEEWVRTSRYDVQTGLGNFTAFKEFLEKELSRLQHRNGVSTLSYLQVIQPEISALPEEIQDQFLTEYLSFILPHLGKMNYIYRLSDALFAVVWVDAHASRALEQIETVDRAVDDRGAWCQGAVPEVKQAWGLIEFPSRAQDVLDIMVKAEQVVAIAASNEHDNVKVYM